MNLIAKSHFPFHTEVEAVEIGEYNADAPCVGLKVWPGAGYVCDLFVVWDCGSFEEALERFAARAVREGWRGYYITQAEFDAQAAELVANGEIESKDDYEDAGGWLYVDYSISDSEAFRGVGPIYVISENMGAKEYESGAACVAAFAKAA